MTTCSFEGCEKPVDRPGPGLCRGHRAQRDRGHELRPLRDRRPRSDTQCAINGCLTPRAGKYCAKHAARYKRHGDPLRVIDPSERRAPSGPDHPGWTDTPNYHVIHERVVALYGPAKSHTCPCGNQARDWAYLGPRRRGERKPFGTVDQYGPRCKSCHTRMDAAAIRLADGLAS